ncbi:MAG: 23S rRNA (adenine(2503)-C(2))-methyltransferase RlmN [Planctomycetota bacterium]|nr:MAG: 23S rRNA (adenine(2503)-C(2))-methyltransferase RlmN [Planctomycetota bacterium]
MGTGDALTLLALTPRETEQAFERLGARPFHARIARAQVFEHGALDYAAMSALPKELRARLAEELPIASGSEVDRRVAADGTTKLLLRFPGAKAVDVETVHLPPSTSGKAATLCVSSQAGCPVGCPFCASGLLGLARNLESAEILEQYVRGRALGALSRSVVMGMGEPLLNYERLARALDVVHDEMGLGARAITVSTVGFPDRLRRIAPTKPRFQLAISLHTPDQEQRDLLVPAMRGVPLAEIVAAADDWFEQTGREVTYEYALLGGCNDSAGHAERLARLLARRRASVNLIPWNPVESAESSPWKRPDEAGVERFRSTLAARGIVATVRWSKGVEADAACGQLRLRHAAPAS